MRVAFLIDRWQPKRGGAEAALCAFGRYLESRGHEVLSFGVEGPRDEVERDLAPGTFKNVSERLGWSGRIGTRGSRESVLARAMTSAASDAECEVSIGVRHLHGVDLYWPHGGGHRATLQAKAAAMASARGESPPIDIVASGRHKAFLNFERELLAGGGARRIACVSTMIRDELAQAYPEAAARLALTPNGIDLERFYTGAKSTFKGASFPEAPLLVFAAREPGLKGLPALCRALSGLQGLPWHLVVAGPAKFRSVSDQLALLGPKVSHSDSISQSKRWTYLPEADLAALFQGAHLCVQPTWRDPCSLTTLESLACGCRVLTTLANGASSHVLGNASAPVQGQVVTTDCGSVIASAADEDALANALRAELERTPVNETRRVRERAALKPAEQTHAQLEALLEELRGDRA